MKEIKKIKKNHIVTITVPDEIYKKIRIKGIEEGIKFKEILLKTIVVYTESKHD